MCLFNLNNTDLLYNWTFIKKNVEFGAVCLFVLPHSLLLVKKYAILLC